MTRNGRAAASVRVIGPGDRARPGQPWRIQMLWIAVLVAVVIVTRVAMHAVQDSRYADAQRREALADIERRRDAPPERPNPEGPGPGPSSPDAASRGGAQVGGGR